jgi:hypothetical protein
MGTGIGKSLPRDLLRGQGQRTLAPMGTGMGRQSPTGNSPLPSLLLSMLVTFEAAWAPCGARETTRETDCRRGRLDAPSIRTSGHKQARYFFLFLKYSKLFLDNETYHET